MMQPRTTRFPIALLKKCQFLTGPTAVGKTAVAFAINDLLAQNKTQSGSQSDTQRHPVEVLALDSMTVYQGMNVGTAKPTADELAKVPHHLIDVIKPHEEYSLSQYVELALQTVQQIVDRGNTPLFVGGTGLYLRGILRGVFEGPPADWEFRNQKEADAKKHGSQWLHDQLCQIDSHSAQRLHPNDLRRVIRAMEVYHLTGKTLTEWHQEKPLSAEARPSHIYWLEPPREWVYERIDLRVHQMIEQGLKEEVENLLLCPEGMGRTARQGLGYKEMITHLEGKCTLKEAVEEIQLRSRQFAKRQHTWFRNMEECTSLPVTSDDSPTEIATRFLE